MIYNKHPEADIEQVEWNGNTYYVRNIIDYTGDENVIGDEELSQAIQDNPNDRELINIDEDIIFYVPTKELYELSNEELCAYIYARCNELTEFSFI